MTRKFTSPTALYEAYAEWLGVSLGELNGGRNYLSNSPKKKSLSRLMEDAADTTDAKPAAQPLTPPPKCKVSSTDHILQSAVLAPSLKKAIFGLVDPIKSETPTIKVFTALFTPLHLEL